MLLHCILIKQVWLVGSVAFCRKHLRMSQPMVISKFGPGISRVTRSVSEVVARVSPSLARRAAALFDADSNSLALAARVCGSFLKLLLLLATLASHSAASELRPLNELELTVKSPVAIAGMSYPVTGGVPFPRGSLSATDLVRLFDETGLELPVQTQVLASWDAAGSQVRWLLLDFQVSRLNRGDTRFKLTYEPSARDQSDQHPSPVDPSASSWPPAAIVQSLYLIDQDGREYRTGLDDEQTIIETETEGPARTAVRVHVWHQDEQGQRLCRAILRLHYYAELDRVRVLHSLVMDADPERVKLRGMGLKLATTADTTFLVSGEQERGESIPTSAPFTLLQDSDSHFVFRGGQAREGCRNGSWLSFQQAADTTAVFVRNGWEEYPKGFRADGRTIDIQLWPIRGCPPLDLSAIPVPILNPTTEDQLRQGLAQHPQAAVSLYRFVTKGQTDWSLDSVVPLMRRARQLEQELLPDRFAYYYRAFGHNGQGSMKTHELVLAKSPGPTDPQQLSQLAQLVRFPPIVSASPQWNCSSGACGPQIPYGVSEFSDVDQTMTYTELADTAQFRERLRMYGARNFGDYLNGNPAVAGAWYHVYGPAAKVGITDRIGWMNNESQDSTVGAWLQFLRTADPSIFYRAESACEHIASVDQKHLFPTPREHLAVSFYHTLNHFDGGPAPSHTLSGGYLLGYYLTGDRGLRETVIANADYFLDSQRRDATGWYAGTSPTRQNIAPMTCILNAYTLTWDPKYLDSLDRFLAVWAPIYDVQEHYLGGTLLYPGAEFLRLVDHPRFRRAFYKIMDDLRTKQSIDGQSPYYMPGLVYMWQVTGDPTYLAYCRLVFQWYRHGLRAKGYSDSVRRLVHGLPEFKYGMVSGYLAAGLAGLEEARRQQIDLDAATQQLRAERSGALYYSVYGAVEGQPGQWSPVGGQEDSP